MAIRVHSKRGSVKSNNKSQTHRYEDYEYACGQDLRTGKVFTDQCVRIGLEVIKEMPFVQMLGSWRFGNISV